MSLIHIIRQIVVIPYPNAIAFVAYMAKGILNINGEREVKMGVKNDATTRGESAR